MNQRKAGALLSYVYLALTFGVGLFYTPFALYYLGTDEYGVFSLAVGIISFMTILDMGFNQTMIRYVARYQALGDKEGEQRLNGMFLILYSLIALVALVIGVVLSFFIEDIFSGTMTTGLTEWEAMELKIIFLILLINLVGSFPLGIYTAILNANEGFVVLKGVNIITFILTYGGMTIALLCGRGAIVMAVITTSVSLVLKFIQGIYVQIKYRPKFRIRGWDKKLFKEIFVFSFFIFLNIVIDQLYANTDKIILGIVQSSVMVSIYTIGVQFSSYFEQFSTSISGVFLPRITKLATDGDMKEISKIFVRIGRIQFLLLGCLMSGFIVLGQMFLDIWVGHRDMVLGDHGVSDAYVIALVVIIPAIIPLSQNIGISVIRALNRHRFRSLVYFVIAVINVGLSVPLAMYFGGIGAACATGFGTILGQIITMNWFYYKKIGLDIPAYWREVAKLVAVMVPVGLIGFGMHMLPFWSYITAWGGWLSFLLQGLCFVCIFFAAGWLFMFNDYEKELLGGIFRTLVRLVLKVIPMRNDVMFESHPDFSDNSGAVYEELLRRKYNVDHRIYWCVHDTQKLPAADGTDGKAADGSGSLISSLPPNVHVVYKSNKGIMSVLKRLVAISRCRFIIDSNSYIHKVRRGQIRLHLGHGMPIKLLPEYTNYREIGECDGYVTCGLYWREIYNGYAHIPSEILLPIGYPRNDVLVEDSRANKRLKAVREAQRLKAKRKKAMDAKAWRELSSEEKMALKESEHGFFWHLNERESFIIWMPTYRQHKNDAGNRDRLQKAYKKSVDDGRWELLAMEALKEKNKPVMPFGMPEIHDTDELKKLDKLLGDAGIKLYFRPHPAQDLYYVSQVELENVRIANDDFLRRCEVSLYELLESSEALITDYSSVYFDYLLTGKPIGLTLGDGGVFFRDCICCFDDLYEELGGFKIDSFDDVCEFVLGIGDLKAGKSSGSGQDDTKKPIEVRLGLSQTAESVKWYHDVRDGSSTDKVIDWLIDHGMPVGEYGVKSDDE